MLHHAERFKDMLHGDDEDCFLEVKTEIKGASRIELYENALRALKENRIPSEYIADTAFRREFKINCITRNEETVVVDFSSRNLTGSRRQESLLIGQIVRTLTHSFDEVDAVAFTVDGEPAETLMGHVDITGSFTARSVLEI